MDERRLWVVVVVTAVGGCNQWDALTIPNSLNNEEWNFRQQQQFVELTTWENG